MRGGIQLLLGRLVQHWADVEPWVVTTAAGDGPADSRPVRAAVRRIGRSRLGGHRATIMRLNAAVAATAARVQPGVLLNAHIVTAPAACVLARLGVPFVQYVYGDEVTYRPRLARLALRHATAVIALSAYGESLARRHGAPVDRIHRIPPGVDLPPEPPAPRAARPTILTIARLDERYKGHDVLIRALPLVRARVPDVEWVVVGEGSLRPVYEEAVRALGIGGHVRFVGSTSDAARDGWLDAAHVFAMPSRLSARGGGEGFGIVYLEAGAHELPVVGGNVGGACDAVVDGVTGVLVDPTDAVAVADAVSDLLLDRPRARALGRAGGVRAQEFAWPRMARQVERLVLETARSAA
jgi:phosphatidylinositol alpha-1,6-mannosyltransferase